MHPLVAANLDSVRELCRRRHVRRLDLIGSGTGAAFDTSRSDLDFLVEFEALPLGTAADTYFALQADLEALFGRRVDLVMAGAATNPYFRRSVEETRVPLYAA